jgi:hypothetical protein
MTDTEQRPITGEPPAPDTDEMSLLDQIRAAIAEGDGERARGYARRMVEEGWLVLVGPGQLVRCRSLLGVSHPARPRTACAGRMG